MNPMPHPARVRRWLSGCLTLLALTLGFQAHAHRLSDSVLRLEPNATGWSATLDLPIRDLALAVRLDADDDGQVTWGELRGALPELRTLLQQKLQFRAHDTVLACSEPELAVSRIAGEPCASLAFQVTALPSAPTTVTYALLFDVDPSHRGLLRVAHGTDLRTHVFSPDQPSHTLADPGILPPPSTASVALQFLREGVHHIWIGIDHILFLLALLLPAVLPRNSSTEGASSDRFRTVAWRVLKLVTAFTIAHSITLICATLDLVQLPSRLVESVIAASVVVAALNNLFPVFRERSVALAFGFGLIHGFGFASVLQDLELPRAALASSLLAFNVGVELGQLAIVAVFLPVAFALRGTKTYRHGALQLGSALILVVATAWLAERALNFDLPGI